MLLKSTLSPVRVTRAWPIALVVLVSSLFAFPMPAYAQNGSYIKPSIAVGEFYDDNLFMIPGADPVTDIVSRVSPGLEVGYRAPRGHLIGHYTFDTEIYPHNTDLNSPFVRQNAGMDLQYQVSPKVSFTTIGTYARTHTPYDLRLNGFTGPTTGLAIGRFEADQIVINPQVTAQVTGRTKAILAYNWLRDGFGGQSLINPAGANTFSSWVSDASARVEHQATGTTMLGVGYTLRQFGFGNGFGVRSNLFLFGVRQQFSPLTSLEVWAGPRITPGDVEPEATATLKRAFQRGDMTLNYAQQQGTTLGALLPLDVRTVNLQISVRTSRRVDIGFGPGYFHTSDGTSNLNLNVYDLGTTIILQLTPQLAVVGSYTYSRQSGRFATFDQALHHQIALISFTVTPQRGVEF